MHEKLESTGTMREHTCGQKFNIYFTISAWKRKEIKGEECSQYQKVYGWKEEQYVKPEQKERETKENPC